MFITLKRTGGFAGIEQDLGSMDTAYIDEDARREVSTALKALTHLVGVQNSPGADRLQYEIEIREPGMTPRTLIVFDEGEPDRAEMRALADLTAALGLTVM